MSGLTILAKLQNVLESSHPVFWFRRKLRRGAKKLHQSCASGLASTFLEKIGRGFYHANFFGHRYRDPLVQRHAIFFREPLRRFLDRKRQFQWISSFAHTFILRSKSAGRNNGTLKRSVIPTKSATL